MRVAGRPEGDAVLHLPSGRTAILPGVVKEPAGDLGEIQRAGGVGCDRSCNGMERDLGPRVGIGVLADDCITTGVGAPASPCHAGGPTYRCTSGHEVNDDVLAEIVVEGILQDLQAEAVFRTPHAWPIGSGLLTHLPESQADEALAEGLTVLKTRPGWAKGLSVEVVGGVYGDWGEA